MTYIEKPRCHGKHMKPKCSGCKSKDDLIALLRHDFKPKEFYMLTNNLDRIQALLVMESHGLTTEMKRAIADGSYFKLEIYPLAVPDFCVEHSETKELTE